MEMPFLEWRSLYVNEERIGRGRMVLYPWLYLSSGICRGNRLSVPWMFFREVQPGCRSIRF